MDNDIGRAIGNSSHESAYLNSCPFCGKDEARYMTAREVAEMHEGSNPGEFTGHFIICDACTGGCGTLTGYSDTKDAAYRLWNTRKFQ